MYTLTGGKEKRAFDEEHKAKLTQDAWQGDSIHQLWIDKLGHMTTKKDQSYTGVLLLNYFPLQ